jgi:uncharacterized repeat protein (TIGR03803 family)
VDEQVLRQQPPAAAKNAAPAGPTSRWTRLDLSISLPWRNQDALARLLHELYDPASPNYHRYLTPQQFADQFGPTEEDYDAVIRFAESHGLTVTARHPNRALLDVRGPVASIERAFHVTLRSYQHPKESRTFFAPDRAPSVDLSVPLLAVSGLDNYFVPRSQLKTIPLDRPRPEDGSGPFAKYLGYDFRRAYIPGVSLTGTGQTVALVEFDAYFPQDVAAYKALAGLPDVPITEVRLDGFSGSPGQENIEVALDIDMAISMAPGLSQVVVYEGIYPQVNSVLSRIATDKLALQISSSWILPTDAATVQIFQQYAAQGQSYYNASGDSGAVVGPATPPTDNPYITVAGGTLLNMTTGGGAYISETGWPGSGGGISTTYNIPSWQQGIDMSLNQGSTTMRNYPDVSMVASDVWLIANNGGRYAVYGTSIAAPLWAGFNALVNQLAIANGQSAVGFINPALYALARSANFTSLFHDITTGNNTNSQSPTRFFDTTGYDLVTGWGSPIGGSLITELALPKALRITPVAADLFTGPVGGPLTPAIQTFSLTNHTAGSLNWTLVNTSLWVNVSPTNGTLMGGGPATQVTASLTAAASNLVAGSFTTTLRFTSLNDNFVQSRTLALAVVTPPIITSQPADQALPQGVTALFHVGTATNAALSFQWQTNGVPLSDGGRISGSATSTLIISNVSPADIGAYSVIVSNVAGTLTSSNALLTIIPSPPLISVQPANQMILQGAPAFFSVTAIGTPPFSYQWQLNGTNLNNGANIIGVNTANLEIDNTSPDNVGTYSVWVTNSLGYTNSTSAMLSLIQVTAPGVTMTTLSTFGNGGGEISDGWNPYGPLVQSGNGLLYGTTSAGGANGWGTLFRAATSGSRINLVDFDINLNGATPYAGLMLAKNGSFYGTAFQGGNYGLGTVFKFSGVTLTTLTTFNGDNGLGPVAGLLQAADGNFYGTALEGGPFGFGTIFKVTAAGALTPLVFFNGANGAYPSCVLVQGADGSLYGTTENGGTNGIGTVFKMAPSGAFTSLYSFTGTNDGAVPIPGLVQGSDGNFYGTTLQGGEKGGFGTVFQITPSGVLTTLYSFSGADDGANPWGGLLLARDGNLYGTTQAGGTYRAGTVFRITANGPLTKLVDFDNYNGSVPTAALMQAADNNLYGTAAAGGSLGLGTLFRISNSAPLQITSQPANQSTFLGGNATFSVATFGSFPLYYQWLKGGQPVNDGGNLLGATNRILTITNVSLDNLDLYSVIVSNASGSVTSATAVLQVTFSPPYVITQPIPQTRVAGSTVTFTVGAQGDLPMYYQWQVNGTNLADVGNIVGSAASTLTLFNVTEANSGTYSVIVSNAFTSVSSAGALLQVVPATPPGSSLRSLYRFTDAIDGAFIYSGLIQGNDGNLYGTASAGGSKYAGSVFRISLGGFFTSVSSFFGGNVGAYPYGRLLQTADGNFHGTTVQGGAASVGTLFGMTPGGALSFPYSFGGGTDGANPVAGLTLGPDGNFYGTAFFGGAYTYGSVFKLSPAGIFTALHSFNGSGDGAYPYAGLTLGADGKFYGAAQGGGANGYGTVFQVTTNGSLTTLFSFNYANGAFPDAAVIQGRDGNFYGATYSGGAGGYGTIFQLTPGGTLTTLASFNSTNGAFPVGALVQGTDGSFYGTTSTGGVGGEGTVFKVTTDGTLTTLVWFDGLNGSTPQAALVQATNGIFYGTTAYGGNGYNSTAGGGYGTVFQLTVPSFISSPFTLAPAISALPYAGTISNQAVSPAGASLSFSKISGPAWLSVAANGAVSGTPLHANIGTNVFIVSLADTNGMTASATMQIVVNSNQPPSFSAGAYTEPWANVDQSYSGSIAGTATDPELGLGDALSYAKVSGPAWLNVASNGTLSGVPHGSDAGTNTFLVSVTDRDSNSSTATFYIYVNSAPYFTVRPFTKPPAVASVPYTGTLVVNATDPDLAAGDTLTFYKVNGPAWLNVAINGGLSGTPANADQGANSFLVVVIDSGGLAGIGQMNIMVNADSPPSFISNPFNAPLAHAGLPYSTTIASSASDPDTGDQLTFAKVSGPAWLAVAGSGALSGTPANTDAGTNTFLISVTDLGGLSNQSQMLLNVAAQIHLSIARQGSQIVLNWTGGSPPYQVQTATGVKNPAWSNFGGPVTTNTLFLTASNVPAFYRVQGQ